MKKRKWAGALFAAALILAAAGCKEKNEPPAVTTEATEETESTEATTTASVSTTENTENTTETSPQEDTAEPSSETEGKEGFDEEKLITESREYAAQMAGGDFVTVTERFSGLMKAQLTSKKLQQAWEDSVKDLGAYLGINDTKVMYQNGYAAVTVILEYENNGLSVLFTYNASDLLDQLWITYSAISKPTDTENFTESEIEIGDPEYPVDGILTLPIGVENPPVVILVHGSGQHDMDETIGAAGNKPFRDIAHGLAEKGIAVIRYNKRYYQYPEMATPVITIEDEVLKDVKAAVQYAVSEEKVDLEQIIVIGHSLGGMLVPKIAEDNPEVTKAVILAGSPRGLEDIILDQNREAINATEDMSEEDKAELLKQVEAEVEKVKNLTDEQLSEPIFGMTGYYWKSLNEIDTPEIAGKLTIPMLIMQGEADFQVYADVDYVQWQALLMGKSNVEFKLYPNLNHMFMQTKGFKNEEDYAEENHVEPQVIQDIADFIGETEKKAE